MVIRSLADPSSGRAPDRPLLHVRQNGNAAARSQHTRRMETTDTQGRRKGRHQGLS